MGDALHHVGAKPLPLPPGVRCGAVFAGHAACYRYSLEWNMPLVDPAPPRERTVMFLLMNPSVADTRCADRTMLKCWSFATAWGCTRMLVGNSAAYRATDQRRLAEVQDPVGPENAWWLCRMASQASRVVIAHGSPTVPAARGFGPAAVALLREAGHRLHVLRLSRHGVPEHPLYLPSALKPEPWDTPR